MTGLSPYGPATRHIRRFLMQLAALDAATRSEVVDAFVSLADTAAFVTADGALAETIERSGRSTERDALAGPLMQIVRRAEAMLPADGTPQAGELDPIAEPALAALLALLVIDLLPARHFHSLYAPFEHVIPSAGLAD